MNFGFTEEQDFLRDAVRKFVDGRCPIPEVRKLMETENAHSDALWKEMAELGWLGLLTPEEHGGAGLSWVDFVVLLEETGRSLLPSPLVSNTLAGTAIREAGSPEQQARWLPALADGSTIGTLAFLEASDVPGLAGVGLRATIDGDEHVLEGEKHFVADVGAADLFVIAYRTDDKEADSDLALALVPATAGGVSIENSPSLDETKRTGTLRLDGGSDRARRPPRGTTGRRDDRLPAGLRSGRGDGGGGRRGRGRAGADGPIRQGSRAVRLSDRTLSGGEASPRRPMGRHRIDQVAALLRGLGRSITTARSYRVMRLSRRPTSRMPSPGSVSRASSSTVPSATRSSMTCSSISSGPSGSARCSVTPTITATDSFRDPDPNAAALGDRAART